MVKIFDLELSKKRFALRIVSAFIFTNLTLFIFYYLPLHIGAIASHFLPNMLIPEVNSLASAISSSALPELGALLAILVFVETLIKGSWVYGALLVILGTFWITYDLTLYREGLLFANLVPSTLTLGNGEQIFLSESAQSTLALMFTGIIILLVISSLFTVISGARILWRKHKAASATRKFVPQNR
jgi:hypothetical protein